jgi:hypothetical protein
VLAPTAGGGFPEGIAPMSFEVGRPVAPWAQLAFDSSATLVTNPNVVRPHDWDDWVISRSLSRIRFRTPGGGRVLVRSALEDAVLAADAQEGKGLVTFVALDLEPQLMNVHPGAHRILGNLLHPVIAPSGQP